MIRVIDWLHAVLNEHRQKSENYKHFGMVYNPKEEYIKISIGGKNYRIIVEEEGGRK